MNPYLIFTILASSQLLFSADNVLHPGSPRLDRPTLVALGIQLPITGDDNFNATVSVRYRKAGGFVWNDAMPLFRVHPETVGNYTVAPQFAGSIFDLSPATTYEIELRASDSDGPVNQTMTLTATTRGIPTDPAVPRRRSVRTQAALEAALASAQAGDVIIIGRGVYSSVFLSIYASGTAANPIVIRGESPESTILDGGNCTDCNLVEIYGSYVYLEGLTLQNGQRAVRFQGTGAAGNVLRRVTIRNTVLGVGSKPNQTDFYISDNILEGRLRWPLTYGSDGGLHSDDTGITVSGSGHVVCHNRISGYGDAIRSSQDGGRANDFYGNDILWTYDNGLELDYSEGNVRAFRNRFTNTLDTLSVQPTRGGPVYIWRNVSVNGAGEQVKFHGIGGSVPQEPNGVFVYHNTFVSPNLSLQVQTGAASHWFELKNNLFIGPTQLAYGYLVDWAGVVDHGSVDYNGYYPDGTITFRLPVTGYVFYNNFAQMQAAGLFEGHGTLLSANIFQNGMVGPADSTRQVIPTTPLLSQNSGAIDRGVRIPNVNDDYRGAAPDLGAFESTDLPPIYGPRPPSPNEFVSRGR